jgi:hypothetical protein
VQRQLAQALFKLSVEFRKEETRFLNKIEQQKGLVKGSSIGLVEEEGPGASATDPGFTESQLMAVSEEGGAHDVPATCHPHPSCILPPLPPPVLWPHSPLPCTETILQVLHIMH